MWRTSPWWVIVCICILAGAARADDDRKINVVKQTQSEKRIALVVGNSSYKAAGALRNPRFDAALVARTLTEVGFAVTTVIDADQKQLKRAIQDFGARQTDSGVGLFYYAGHAIQVNGRNYMIPVDATIAAEADVEIESVDVAAVLAKMSSAKHRMNIVILDACRNNPFARSFRSTTNGLAFTDAPQGTLIAFATAPGDVAADGRGDNSPYTEALARHMRIRGLEVGQLFRSVRSDVRERTGGKQIPWESSSVEGQFYFVMPDAVEVPPAAPKLPPVAAATGTDVIGARAIEPGQLRVETDMPGARIEIDGQPAGVVPMTIARIDPGIHAIVARVGPYVGRTEVVVEKDRPARAFVKMRFEHRVELGLDGMYTAAGKGFFVGQAGVRARIREGDSGVHGLQLGVGAGLFDLTETSNGANTDTVAGIYVSVMQAYRVPLGGANHLASRSLDLSGGMFLAFADGGKGDFGAILRTDVQISKATLGGFIVLGSNYGFAAGLGVGARFGL